MPLLLFATLIFSGLNLIKAYGESTQPHSGDKTLSMKMVRVSAGTGVMIEICQNSSSKKKCNQYPKNLHLHHRSSDPNEAYRASRLFGGGLYSWQDYFRHCRSNVSFLNLVPMSGDVANQLLLGGVAFKFLRSVYGLAKLRQLKKAKNIGLTKLKGGEAQLKMGLIKPAQLKKLTLLLGNTLSKEEQQAVMSWVNWLEVPKFRKAAKGPHPEYVAMLMEKVHLALHSRAQKAIEESRKKFYKSCIKAGKGLDPAKVARKCHPLLEDSQLDIAGMATALARCEKFGYSNARHRAVSTEDALEKLQRSKKEDIEYEAALESLEKAAQGTHDRQRTGRL